MFYSITTIKPICDDLHREGKKIVLATGFFDLLHSEHIKFLEKAKAEGDILLVAVESDVRASKIKGEGRPIETQHIRCQHLLELMLPTGSDLEGSAQPKRGRSDPQGKLVDYVVALGSDFDNGAAYESLMASVRPTIYAVSSHTEFQPNKTLLTAKYGGQLQVVHNWNPSVSTTKILESKNNV